MFSKIFAWKNIIAISPFPPAVVNGVTWRINFINQLILNVSPGANFFYRGPKSKNTQLLDKNIYGHPNRFIHLFDPFLLLKIIFRPKKNVVLYCHTYLTWLYWVFFSIIFRIPFIFDDHNIEFDRFKSSRSYISYFIFFIEYAFIYFSEVLIVSSDNDKDRAIYLFKPKKILVVKNVFAPWKEFDVQILSKYNIAPSKKLLLFFGAMNYAPNKEACLYIQDYIAPFLDPNMYLILIAGLHSEEYESLNLPVKYLGFVEDIDSLILSVDLIMAPIFSGWWVKIKVLQTLSLNKPIITTLEGARGIDRHDCMIISSKDRFLSDILYFFWSS